MFPTAARRCGRCGGSHQYCRDASALVWHTLPVVLLQGALADGVIRLRPIVRSDGPALLHHISSDPEISRWTRIPFPYSQTHCDEFLDLVEGYNAGTTDIVAAVCTDDNDALIGSCGVHRIGVEVSNASSFLASEVGYWLAAEHRGNGVMTRAVRMLSQFALANCAIPLLRLQTKTGNRASQDVARSVGYRYLGVVSAKELVDDIHDSERYEMNVADYEATHGALVPADVLPLV